MSAPFVEHPVHRQRRVSKNLIVKHITGCTNEIYRLDLKEIVLNRSTKGSMPDLFAMHHVHSFLSGKKPAKLKYLCKLL